VQALVHFDIALLMKATSSNSREPGAAGFVSCGTYINRSDHEKRYTYTAAPGGQTVEVAGTTLISGKAIP
jgi:hypothetical protein